MNSSPNPAAATADGSTSGMLRQAAGQQATSTSRRNMLRRGGMVAAAAAGLTLLDQRRAEAATGGNFILGHNNDADATTELHVTTSGTLLNPLFHVNGSAASSTSTSMVVDGPNGGQSLGMVVNNGLGGLALRVNSSSTATTTGLAIQANGAGSAGGIAASSGTGVGVAGSGKRGGVFSGTAANIQLTAHKGAHPRVGQTGDLFVDHNHHLWFCRGGTTWVRLA